MNILVTGSEGFIGKHLVERLKLDGHKVEGWDIVDGQDTCDTSLSPSKKLDAIFHLACPVDPGNYKEVALDTIRASVLGTMNILKLAVNNSAKFLYVSSSEVYGEQKKRDFKEDDLSIIDPSSKRSFYDSSKVVGEVLTTIYHNYYNLDTRIVRPFNIYGPGMRATDNRVIPSFMRKIKNNESIQITGTGENTRSFCYISDFVECILRTMFYPNTNGETFNIGTIREISIKQLVEILDYKKVEYIPARTDEQVRRRPIISKVKEILNWKPTTSLEKGLELTWQSYL